MHGGRVKGLIKYSEHEREWVVSLTVKFFYSEMIENLVYVVLN